MTWIISQALMNSLCSQEQGAEYSEGISLDGAQSVQSNGNPTQQAYLSPGKTTGYSRLSRFGMTFKLLSDTRGEELLTLYLAGFPVKIFQQRGGGRELLERAQECGNIWQGLLAKLDPVTSLWRTAQCSLSEDWELSLQTFPRWGSMRNGELYLGKTQGPFISESEFGLSLPTPGKNEFAGTSRKRFRNSPHFRGAKTVEALRICESEPSCSHPQFIEEIMGFPTTWTELQPLAMHRFQEWLQRHGKF